jgi:hypothetical protein
LFKFLEVTTGFLPQFLLAAIHIIGCQSLWSP